MRRPSPRVARVAVYLGLAVPVAIGLLRLQATTDELHDVIEAEEAEERVEAARLCVSQWEVRDQIRQSDEDHGEAAGEALIDVVQPDDAALVERYRTVLAERLRAASDEIADPDCDLDAARRLIADPARLAQPTTGTTNNEET